MLKKLKSIAVVFNENDPLLFQMEGNNFGDNLEDKRCAKTNPVFYVSC